jgi:hypothetical protein
MKMLTIVNYCKRITKEYEFSHELSVYYLILLIKVIQ